MLYFSLFPDPHPEKNKQYSYHIRKPIKNVCCFFIDLIIRVVQDKTHHQYQTPYYFKHPAHPEAVFQDLQVHPEAISHSSKAAAPMGSPCTHACKPLLNPGTLLVHSFLYLFNMFNRYTYSNC